MTNAPAWLQLDPETGLLTGTPPANSPTSKFRITFGATNAFGTGGANCDLSVKLPAPVITGTTTATATHGQPFSYQIIASNSPTSYNAQNLPSGLSVNTRTGLITGTVTGASSTYSVKLNATNSGGTGKATLNLTVGDEPVWGVVPYAASPM